MDRLTQAQVLREQRAGYDTVRKHDVEAARIATLDDRVRAFNNIMGLARALGIEGKGRANAADVAARWIRMKERHVASTR